MSARVRVVGLILTGIAAGALLGGPATAKVGGKLGKLTKRLDPIYLNQTEKAADSNQLDGLDSTQFVRSNGKAADSDRLDNIDSASFLQTTSSLGGSASCPGAGFHAEDQGANDIQYTDSGGTREAQSPGFYVCAMHLPDGATVSGVSLVVSDLGATDVTNCALWRTDLTIPFAAQDTVNNPATTAGLPPGSYTITGPITGANALIDNDAFGYSLRCNLGTYTGIRGGIVTYTVPASSG